MRPRDYYVLPKFADRWSHLYLEHGRLDKKDNSLAFYREDGVVHVPIDQLGLVMLGPGTTITHRAVQMLAENSCLLCWAGEYGVRMYAHSTGSTHFSKRLLHQARMYCDEESRLRVIRKMYQKRFEEKLDESLSIEQIRGMEGARVRNSYQVFAKANNIEWAGRNYDQDNWANADPVNRALSAANSCLYGICHSAILAAGYSAAIGFIHTGKMLSFVYDMADLYKTELTIPIAFSAAKEFDHDVERSTRLVCRDVFHEKKIMERILPDIAEVLDVGDDLREIPGELEGRIITLADRAKIGSVSWEPEHEGEG